MPILMSMTNDPHNDQYIPAAHQEEAPNELDLLAEIRGDVSSALLNELTHNDAKAEVLISSVDNGVFVSAIVESKSGEFRFADLTLSSIYQMWQLKKEQYREEKGGWLSVKFTVDADGFVEKTKYNYDKRIYSGNTPEEWFLAPEQPIEGYASVWTDEQYYADLAAYPRNSGPHEWLESH